MAWKKTSVQLTFGAYDDAGPAWSPDGRWVAFVSNRTQEPDANFNTDIFIVSASAGAADAPRRVTSSDAAESSPVFTRDGSSIVFSLGGSPKDIWYTTDDIASVPVAGGIPRRLTEGLDRNRRGSSCRLTADTSCSCSKTPATRTWPGCPSAADGWSELCRASRDVNQFDVGPKGELAVLETTFSQPAEIAMVGAGGALTRITKMNDEFLAGIALGTTERFSAKSADGTMIDGFLTRPPQRTAGRGCRPCSASTAEPSAGPRPASISSGRYSPRTATLSSAANPRGSSGRGRDFSYAIWADWGNRDFQDVMAAVDHVIAMGVADPNRLGVGGWSYGGMLTNYVITKTTRFKGAISGASEVNYLANYGHDHYQRQWEAELGLPWDRPEVWMKLSPFYQVAKVKTPTLILCGQDDWNVPLVNSEQLYQALRRLGVPTELVIYPGQGHGIRQTQLSEGPVRRDWPGTIRPVKQGASGTGAPSR